MEAVRQVVEFGPAAVWPLRHALSDQNDAIRAGALLALGQLRRPALLPLLVDHLKDRRSVVRFAARRALLDFGPAALAALPPFLGSRSARIRRGVIAILRDFGAVSALLHALDHSSPGTRADAARALGTVGSPRATARLIAALEADAADEVRRAAAWALLELGDRRAIPALTRAAGALRLHEDPLFVERLRDVLRRFPARDSRAPDIGGHDKSR